ncbi:YaaC family protein [Thermolongibacillus altinsuensis]|jgi:hypothetical protein|nr:YaaC family protein [Thermolongibacillus altinsuensis]GMB10170.1 hypothetical protein B1no1_28800 [Thermolongibacillus altinsuensis]
MNRKNIWGAFHSSNFVQKLLYDHYIEQGRTDAEKKSYENSYALIYYLEHGESFYKTAHSAPLAVKPVLLFYGMVQLLKACLLAVNPDYPESTSVLAHGVSTRKRKKQNYDFFEDEVKIQKHGLFTYFSEKMFHVKHIHGEKFQMKELLKKICELHDLFLLYFNHPLSIEIIYNELEKQLLIPIQILDKYHLTVERWVELIVKKFPFLQHTSNKKEAFIIFSFSPEEKISQLIDEPFMFNIEKNCYVCSIERTNSFPDHEIIAHYLLLYNLSMICRYETEWWNDLLHSYSSDAYPFVVKFLSVTEEKVPFLLHKYLIKKLVKEID